MDAATIEQGSECPDCLRWFVPVFKEDGCPHCKNYGTPLYPNRVRYFAVKNGITLREVSRKAGLEWRTVKLIAQGKRAPHTSTKKKILRALGMSIKKSEMTFVFPHERRRI